MGKKQNKKSFLAHWSSDGHFLGRTNFPSADCYLPYLKKRETRNVYDLLVENGRIISGLGNPWFWADLAVAKDKIAKIGRLIRTPAKRVIDAKGCFVAPGFIDGHTHSDLRIFVDPEAKPKIMQGVTTENLGMDGLSVAPIQENDVADWRKFLSGLAGDPDIKWSWRSFSDYFDAIDALPTSVNITSYVGLGTIRLKVMGMTDRNPTTDEIHKMKQIAAQAMEEGARGISSGLIYPPCQYQTLDEVVEIAKVVREYDGIYDVHIRNEGDGVIPAIQEVIEIGRQAKIPVLITHFKVMGKRNWGLSEKTLKMVDDARQEGVEVTIAQYPYIAGSTMLHSVIPPWYSSKGPDKLVEMLSSSRESIKKDIRETKNWENWQANVGWENIVVSSVKSDTNKKYEGKSIAEIAAMRNLGDPADAALNLLSEEELAVGMIIFGMNEDDVVRIMRHPCVSFITDGIVGGSKPHPRVYGSYPRILGRYVREQGIMTFEEAVRKMTSAAAEKIRLRSKGVLAEGFDADITIFNPNTVIDKGTFDNPSQFPEGIDWVVVNGVVVVERGKHTGATPGRTIRTR